MAKRKTPSSTDGSDDVQTELQDMVQSIEDRITAMDEDTARELINTLAETWHLKAPVASFEHSVSMAFHNFGLDIMNDLDFGEGGTFGIKEVDHAIHEKEMEAVALYHQLRRLDLTSEPEIIQTIEGVLENLFYAKKLVLSAMRHKLAMHNAAASSPEEKAVLDDDLDERLGNWSIRFRWFGDQKLKDVQKLVLHLLDTAMESSYRKQGGCIFEPVIVDGHNTHAWRQVSDITQFVYRHCQKDTQLDQFLNLTSAKSNIDAVVEYLKKCRDMQLPWLVKQRDVFAFTDGVYLARSDTFHEFATATRPLPDTVVAAKFFDLPGVVHARNKAWRSIPTPHLDGILGYQKFSQEVCDWMFILIGRMLYDLGELDGWQIIPFLLGQAGSGKCFGRGTLIMMYDGRVKPVESINIGDILMGDDSTARTVLNLARGEEELYQLSYKNGSVCVTRDHILCLKYDRLPDDPIIEMTVGEYLSMESSHRKYLKMYRAAAGRLEFPNDALVFAFEVKKICGSQPYYGFQTDGNQRFLLADGLVTHNSTIVLHICKNMYDTIDVGILSNNIERRFGISALIDKKIYLAPEIKQDLAIEQAEFQSMVSGEEIQVARKFKDAVGVRWLVPGFLAGNQVPAWCDNSGSIQRRLVVFNFERGVTQGDMKLGEKLHWELAAILIKCNKAYLEACDKWGSQNIWSVLPAYFKGTRDEMAQAVNSAEAFLASPEVVLGVERFCPFEDFKAGLKAYEASNGFKPSKYVADFFRGPFNKFGITKVRDTMEYRGRRLKKEYIVGVDLVYGGDETNVLG